jgi:hypothetical protein
MRSAVEFCIFGFALFVAVVAGFYLAVALGFGESIWEPLAALGGASGVMGLLGLSRTDGALEERPGGGSTRLGHQVE